MELSLSLLNINTSHIILLKQVQVQHNSEANLET